MKLVIVINKVICQNLLKASIFLVYRQSNNSLVKLNFKKGTSLLVYLKIYAVAISILGGRQTFSARIILDSIIYPKIFHAGHK